MSILAYTVTVPANTTYDLFQGGSPDGECEVSLALLQAVTVGVGPATMATAGDGFIAKQAAGVVGQYVFHVTNEGLWLRTDGSAVDITVIITRP